MVYVLTVLGVLVVWLTVLGVISQPTTEPRTSQSDPGQSAWTIRRLGLDRVMAGQTATGGPLIHRFPGDHRLVAGITRSGKSCTVHALLAGFSTIADAAFVGIDPKRTELKLWTPRFTEVAVDLADIDLAIQKLVRLMKTRQAFLELQGLTKWVTALGPWVFVVIDEYAELVGVSTDGIDRAGSGSDINDGLKRSKALGAMRIADISSLARLGAGLGIKLIITTQYPTAEVLDTQIRNQLDTRLMHRVSGDSHVKVCLGDGRASQVSANSIPTHLPGALWVVGSEDYNEPVLARSSYVAADEIPGLAAETAGLAWSWEQLLALQTLADKRQELSR